MSNRPEGYPAYVEHGRHRFFYDAVAPLTKDGIYKRTDPKTGMIYHVLLIKG